MKCVELTHFNTDFMLLCSAIQRFLERSLVLAYRSKNEFLFSLWNETFSNVYKGVDYVNEWGGEGRGNMYVDHSWHVELPSL